MKTTDFGTAVFGFADEKTLLQIKDVSSRAVRTALMADNHLGYIMPIGGVAAYRNKASVAGVGFDIACGNAAIRTDMTLEQLSGVSSFDNPYAVQSNVILNKIADEIASTISFGIGRTNRADDAPVNDPLFIDDAGYVYPNTGAERAYRDEVREMARRQLGTVGSGNHYVDVFVDENGYLWVGVHFGSRGLGHKTASNFMALSQGKTWGEHVKEAEALLDLDTQLEQDYWALMNLAGKYAYAGREWVARKVASIFGGKELELVHNHHNFAWKEMHDGEELIVVRKGATPAFPGQKGFVGGSMGDNAVILEGTRSLNPEGQNMHRMSLSSTVHGAGRVMSRNEAAGKLNRKTGKRKTEGKVKQVDMDTWLREKGVVLRGGGLDESPQAYRRLPDVLTEQGDTVTILHTLRPIIVVMAGANEFDPYKD